MSTRYPINFSWRFICADDLPYSRPDHDDSMWQLIDIPHTLVQYPLQYGDEQSVATVGWYRKRLILTDYPAKRRLKIRFEGVANRSTVYLDGHPAGTHEGAFTPFEIDIPDRLREKPDILIALRCDATESPQLPPFGHVVDYLVQGGMYREVSVVAYDVPCINDVFCYSTPQQDARLRKLSMQVALEGKRSTFSDGMLSVQITDSHGTRLAKHTEPLFDSPVMFSFPVGPVDLWDIEHPHLYTVQTDLVVGGNQVDTAMVRIGFRDIAFTADGFFLNGRRVKLRGLNRHQDYPHVGYAMPWRQQYRDAEFLKNELHVTMVRTSHYPQSPHFLDRCDELGLLVFEELPGWQHIGSSEHWRSLAVSQLHDMIRRDRNHPSIIMWGVRINESADDDELYSRTNAVAKDLDPSRPTGGVRNFAGSQLLEDVYTYNDFSHTGKNDGLQRPQRITKSKDIPYLVTEHTGHMFPCRPSDLELVRTEHALRHATVLDAMYGDPSISGAIGWCMADYHTHRQFGGGDGICWHGVADIFRIPKLAASVYASQQSDVPVMVVSSQFRIGSRPAHLLDRICVFTNCDSVVLSYEGEPVGTYFPDRKRFAHLPHPPMFLDDLIGSRVDSLSEFSHRERSLIRYILNRFATVGFDLPMTKKLALGLLMRRHHLSYADAVNLYERFALFWDGTGQTWTVQGWKDDVQVASIRLGPMRDLRLVLTCDDNRLAPNETYDVVRCVVSLEDANGQVAWMSSTPVHITVSGAISLIGPGDISLSGGYGGFYVRSGDKPGEGMVQVSSAYYGTARTRFQVD